MKPASHPWMLAQRIGALFMLIALSPLILLIAIGIKATSKGPVVFKQERPGYMGKRFSAFKFRSMYTGSEAATRLGVTGGDPRITPIGRFLRSSKLDELPQLLNIVRGSMAFVGPRPLPIALDRELRNAISGFEERYSVLPGLTSLAQVCIADNKVDDHLINDWSQRFEAERRYIRNRSVPYDLLVLSLTAAYIVRKLIRS